MAKKPKISTSKPDKKKVKKPAGIGLFYILSLFIIAGFFSVGSAVALALGMMPTYVLFAQKKTPLSRMRSQVVGLSNLAGVLPFVERLWDGQNISMELGSPLPWVIMYGAAALGYVLLYVGPMMAAISLQVMAGERIKKIARHRQKLIDEWGPEVAFREAKSTESPKS